MIDFLADFKTLTLTAFFNPAFLGLLLILFFAGRFFGKLTRRLNIWKILIVGYFSLFLFPAVRDAGPILGGIFLLGITSNHIGTLFSAFSWAGNLGDMIYAFRYRTAFDDIRRREQDLDERERKLKDEERRRAYSAHDQGQRTRARWQDDAKGFRGQKSKNASADEKAEPHSNRAQGRQKPKPSKPPRSSAHSRHLQAIGLEPGRSYSRDEMKRAYRKRSKATHPDAGGNAQDFIAVQAAWKALRSVLIRGRP